MYDFFRIIIMAGTADYRGKPQSVLNKRYSSMLGGPEYLVKWSNIPWGQPSDMSWEPYYRLVDDHAIDLIRVFNQVIPPTITAQQNGSPSKLCHLTGKGRRSSPVPG